MDHQYTVDWFSQNVPTWENLFNRFSLKLRKVLEIGSYEGLATTWIIEHLVGPEAGELFCVDTWEGGVEHDKVSMGDVERRFDHNAELALRKLSTARMIKIKGRSAPMLARLLTEGHGNSFDFIYVDGSHLASDVLTDLTLSFALCRVGGLIACDDYLWNVGDDPSRTPKLAIDAFTACFVRRVKPISAWLYQYYMLKIAD